MDYVKLLKSAVEAMTDDDQEMARRVLRAMMSSVDAPSDESEVVEKKVKVKARRSPGSGRRGHLYKAVEFFGTGGTIRQIGDKARELGMRLPPDPIKQDRSILDKLMKSPNSYKKNEDDTWRLVRLPKNGPAPQSQSGLPLQ